MYDLEEDILHYIFQAFHGMERRKEKIAMVFHSVMVGTMLRNIGCPDEVVYIGYLHDVLEDTSVTYEELSSRYGKNIADSVLMLSEDQRIKDWKQRKQAFLNSIRDASAAILTVELADKLQNLMSDYELFLKKGKEALVTEADRFADFVWFYQELEKLFLSKIPNCPLLKRYSSLLQLYFS